MNLKAVGLATGLLFAMPLAATEERPVRFSVSDSWAMPVVDIEDDKAVDGILPDLYHRLATLVGRDAELVVLPRRRIAQALERGQVDAHCYTNPQWLESTLPGFTWSAPLMTQDNLLIARHGTPPLPALGELQGERIATVLGFIYPVLTPYFERGQLLRTDIRTQEQVLQMVAAGRLDYGVSSALALGWYNRGLPAEQQLQAVSTISSTLVACVVSEAPQVPTQALLRAIVRVKRDGTFESILKRYR